MGNTGVRAVARQAMAAADRAADPKKRERGRGVTGGHGVSKSLIARKEWPKATIKLRGNSVQGLSSLSGMTGRDQTRDPECAAN
jgi:hypothetical protein